MTFRVGSNRIRQMSGVRALSHAPILEEPILDSDLLPIYQGRNRYTNDLGGNEPINAYLRNGLTDPRLRAEHASPYTVMTHEDQLDLGGDEVAALAGRIGQQMQQQPISNYNTAYRGISLDPTQVESFLAKNAPGRVISDRGYFSASGKEKVANQFATKSYIDDFDPDYDTGVPVVYQINNPLTGRQIAPTSYSMKQDNYDEVAFMPNTAFRSQSIEPSVIDGQNGYRVNINELPENPIDVRTQGILGRLKPRLSAPELIDQHLEMAQPQPRQAVFQQLGDGTHQSYIDGKPYKILTEAETDAAIDRMRNDPKWQMSWKAYQGDSAF